MQNLATEEYFYGAGQSAFQALDASDIPTGALLFLGNADSAKITLKVDRKEKRESMSGQNALVRSKVVQLGGEIEIVFNESQADNLALFLFGTKTSRAALSVATADAHKLTVAETGTAQIGNIYRLEYQNINTVTITDDGAMDAVISATKYEVDAVYGKIKVKLDFAGTGPYTVKYKADAATLVPVFQLSDKALLYRHEGINIANDTDKNFLVEVYKVKLDPVADLALITDDFGKFTIKGQVLKSSYKAATAGDYGNFGSFGRFINL